MKPAEVEGTGDGSSQDDAVGEGEKEAADPPSLLKGAQSSVKWEKVEDAGRSEVRLDHVAESPCRLIDKHVIKHQASIPTQWTAKETMHIP